MRSRRSRQAASRTATAMSQRMVQTGQARWQPGVDRTSTGSDTRQWASLWVLLATLLPPFRLESCGIITISVLSGAL